MHSGKGREQKGKGRGGQGKGRDGREGRKGKQTVTKTKKQTGTAPGQETALLLGGFGVGFGQQEEHSKLCQYS